MLIKKSPQKNIVIAVSGTGGHIYPGIAIAKEFQSRGYSPIFLTSKNAVSTNIIEQSGFEYIPFNLKGLPRKISFALFPFCLKMFLAFFKALFCLIKLRPIALIATGGYIEVPAVFAAKLLRKPIYLHEQNAIPGKANKLLSRFADKTFISFKESSKFFAGETAYSGYPIRREIHNISRDKSARSQAAWTIFIFGGSLGAVKLNEIAFEAICRLSQKIQIQAIHITGRNSFDAISSKASALNYYKAKEYMHDIYKAYAAADLIIARAGAGAVFEIKALSKPAIFIPYPYAAENHQFLNAKAIEKKGFIEVIEEKDLTAEILAETILRLKENRLIDEYFPPCKPLPQEMIADEIICKP
jgi:UDP-N-acetylglucosamine--N-acetylmuramyl-(pentapeptide) pyrophosphoryl-undecaprenol N-acetylglucosamine transferase